MQITGSDGNGVVHVNPRKRLDVSSMSAKRIYYVARDDKKAFQTVYDGMTIVQNDVVAHLKNTSTDQNIVIAGGSFGSSVAQKLAMFFCTGTAAAGETVIPTNTHSLGGAPQAEAMAGNTSITGLTQGASIGSRRIVAGTTIAVDFQNALILAPGAQIMVVAVGSVGGDVDVSILFHLESVANP